jgi:hypothetical protein
LRTPLYWGDYRPPGGATTRVEHVGETTYGDLDVSSSSDSSAEVFDSPAGHHGDEVFYSPAGHHGGEVFYSPAGHHGDEVCTECVRVRGDGLHDGREDDLW